MFFDFKWTHPKSVGDARFVAHRTNRLLVRSLFFLKNEFSSVARSAPYCILRGLRRNSCRMSLFTEKEYGGENRSLDAFGFPSMSFAGEDAQSIPLNSAQANWHCPCRTKVMYMSNCRNSLLKKIRPQLPHETSGSPEKISGDKKAPIPVDGRSYLTNDGGGYFVLWDKRSYPASLPMARIDAPMVQSILRNSQQGKRLLKDLYSRYEKQMKDQGAVNRRA